LFFPFVNNTCLDLTSLLSVVLSLPLHLSSSGYVLTTIFFVLLAIINAFTADLLVKCCVHTQLTTFNELAEKAYGRWMSLFIDLLIVLFGLGCMMAFTVALGDFGCSLVVAFSYECQRPVVVYIVSLFTMLPLCSLRTLNSLRYVTFFCLVILLFFMFSTVGLAAFSFK